MNTLNASTLIFIDATVIGYQNLIDSVHPGVNIIILDPTRDGIAQITKAIAQHYAIDTIHIVSHGEPGRLYLGASELGLSTLSRYAKQLRSWSAQLTENAEILIYGCKVAYGAVGSCFIRQVSRLTGATIAASANLTGNAELGGDWELEVKTGDIRSALAFPSSTLAAYPFVLAEAFPNLLYGVAGTDLRIIDAANGSSTSAGTLSFSSFAISRESNTGRVYYIESTNTTNTRVAYWDPITKTNVLVGKTGVPAQFLKMAQAQDETIYALTGGTKDLYKIDLATGAASSLGIITDADTTKPKFAGASGDAAFDPQNAHRMFITTIVSNSLHLYTVDTDPASPTFLKATYIGDTSLGNATSGIGSLAFGEDGQLYATSQISGTPSLYRIDQTNGTSTLVGSTSGIGFSDLGTLPTPTAEVDIQVIANTDSLTNVTPGSSITYTVTVKNNSAIFDLRDIAVADAVPSGITGVTWTAVITGGGSFPSAGDAAGSGNNINAKVKLNAGASVTYTITGTVSATAIPGSTLTNTATATVPKGIIDPNTTNNSLSDTTTIVAPDTTPPVVTVNTLTTTDGTPQLTGNVDDPDAMIVITVNGKNYTATNNKNGTWTLVDDTINPALTPNTYEVTAKATDKAGNAGTDGTTNELTVTAPPDTTPPVITVNTLTTTDGTPQLTGNVDDPDATVVVTVNGKDYTATNNKNGTWTLADDTINPVLAANTYDVTAKATDKAGNVGTDSTTNELTIEDKSAPIVTVNTLTTKDGTPQLTGGVDDPDAVVIVTINSKDYTATNNKNGTWILADDTIAPALAVNTYDVVAKATDKAGNIGTDSTTNELTIEDTTLPDTTPPVVTVNFLTTKDGTPQLTGTVNEHDATVIITVNGKDYTAINNKDGTWTLADNVIDSALAANTYEVIAKATDEANNVGTDGTTNELTIEDTTSPVITVDTLTTADGTPQLTGNVDDPDATVVITINGKNYNATNNKDGTWTLADDKIAPALTPDTYNVTATATDTAGNAGTDATSNELTITAPPDTTPPVITVNTLTTTDGTPQLTGDVDDPDATVFVTVNGKKYDAINNKNGHWTLADDKINPVLTPNTYEVTATATDQAGNTGTDTTIDELTIEDATVPDTTPPVVSVNFLTTKDGTPQLTGKVDEHDATVVVTVNGKDYTATNNKDGTWTLADNTIDPALSASTYEITATATDKASNVGTDGTTNELTIESTTTPDNTPPIITVNSLTTKDGSPQLTGGVDDPDAVIIITVNGKNYTAINNKNGTWTLVDNTIAPALAANTYEITAKATDKAGNIGADKTTNELTIESSVTPDITPPVVTVNFLTTTDGTPQLTGTVNEDDATVVVTVNGKNYAATNNKDGTWTLVDNKIAPALTVNIYDVVAKATDEAGNVGTDTTANELVITSGDLNQAPATQDGRAAMTPGSTTQIQALSATDADGSIAAYKLATLPEPQQGILYLGNPASGGTAVQAGQTLTIAESQRLFFQATSSFTGTRFTYAAIDNQGLIDPTPATIDLSAAATELPNLLPVAKDVTFSIDPEAAANVTGLSATDADGTIISYTISTLPPTQQGILFLGNPNTGGTAITIGQALTPAQVNQLFFQSASGFTGSQFTYTATDDRGLSDPTPATVTLSLSEFANCDCGCEVGIRFQGNNRKNQLSGTPNRDVLMGRKGNDILHGKDCNDLVKGGRGKDRLFGDDGKDTLLGGLGHDRLAGGRQDDLLKGGRGNDRLRGNAGNDRLQGGTKRDRLFGGSGNDTLNGGLGKDILRGGQGDDRLLGRRDSDRLRGGAGQDTLSGGLRADRLSGFKGNDRLQGGAGKDQLWGGRGNDTLRGGIHQDRLRGNQGHDCLIGGRGDDVLRGDGGDDLLIGRRGNDTLQGGAGNDQFFYGKVKDAGDCIKQFEVNQDVINLSRIFDQRNYPGSRPFKQYVKLMQDGLDTIVHIDTNGKTANGFVSLVTLENIAVTSLSANNFIL